MKFSRYTKGRSGTLALRAVQVAELSLGSVLGLCVFESIASGQFGGTTKVSKVVPPKDQRASVPVRLSLAKFVTKDGGQSYI